MLRSVWIALALIKCVCVPTAGAVAIAKRRSVSTAPTALDMEHASRNFTASHVSVTLDSLGPGVELPPVLWRVAMAALQGLHAVHAKAQGVVHSLRAQVRESDEELKANERSLLKQERRIAEAEASLRNMMAMLQRLSSTSSGSLESGM